MTEPRNTLGAIAEIAPRVTTTTQPRAAADTTVAGTRFISQWRELADDVQAIAEDIETYRNAPTADFVDLDDVGR